MRPCVVSNASWAAKSASEHTVTPHGFPCPLLWPSRAFQAVTRATHTSGASHRFKVGSLYLWPALTRSRNWSSPAAWGGQPFALEAKLPLVNPFALPIAMEPHAPCANYALGTETVSSLSTFHPTERVLVTSLKPNFPGDSTGNCGVRRAIDARFK
jgi:hypothetical protein